MVGKSFSTGVAGVRCTRGTSVFDVELGGDAFESKKSSQFISGTGSRQKLKLENSTDSSRSLTGGNS